MVITSFAISFSNVAYNTVAQHIAIQAIQHKFDWTEIHDSTLSSESILPKEWQPQYFPITVKHCSGPIKRYPALKLPNCTDISLHDIKTYAFL